MGRAVEEVRLLKPKVWRRFPLKIGLLCLGRGVSQMTLGPQEVVVEVRQRPLGPQAVQEGSSLREGPIRIGTLKGRALVLMLW